MTMRSWTFVMKTVEETADKYRRLVIPKDPLTRITIPMEIDMCEVNSSGMACRNPRLMIVA